MNKIKQFITFLDKVPEGKELSIRQQITLILWGITIVLLPFFRFPYGEFEKLSLYPLLLIAFINIDKWWNLCWHNKFLRYTAFAIAAFIAWQLISLPFSVGLSNINFADNIKPSINDMITYGAWYVFLATCFLLPQEKIRKTFYWSLTVTLLYCCAYSVIEILHWSKVQWATDFLSKSIYFFQKDVGQYCGWWPPVFWDAPRLRAIFGEPSYFAVLLTFAVLYYGFAFWRSAGWKKISGNALLMILSVLALCGTQSASGTVSLAGSTVLFIVLFAIFFRKFNKFERIKGSILSILLLVFSAMVALNQRGGINDWLLLLNKISETSQPQQQQQKKFDSSSGTRLIHLKAEIKLIAERPLCGYGQGNYGPAMKQALLESPEKTGEIRLWSENEEFVPPSLNKYTQTAINSGLTGLVFFFLMFLPALVCCIKCIKTMKADYWITSTILCGAIAIIFSTVSTDSLYCFSLLAFPFYTYIIGKDTSGK